MNCSHPFRLFPTGRLTENGKPEYFFDDKQSSVISVSSLDKKWPEKFWFEPLTEFVEVPCGKCFGCLQDKSRMWSFRVVAESLDYPPEEVWFFTLTYDNKHLPLDRNPSKKDLSDFLKALRKRVNQPIRFFGCGELGDQTLRPHIHVVLFGFPGKDFIRVPYDSLQFQFPQIEDIWKKGFCPGSMVQQSGSVGAYVSKYMLKDYGRSGCWLDMSRRPGIGYNYLEPLAKKIGKDGAGILTVPSGRGQAITNAVPKSLRQRLGISSDLFNEAQYIKVFGKMKSAGYTDDQATIYAYVEAYRETVERINKRKETFARYSSLVKGL